MNDTETVTVAMLSRRNGAWLIQYTGPTTDDWTADAQFDCAASLKRAKQLARADLAERITNGEPFRKARWVQDRNGYDLEAEYDWSNQPTLDDVYADYSNSADHGGPGGHR